MGPSLAAKDALADAISGLMILDVNLRAVPGLLAYLSNSVGNWEQAAGLRLRNLL